ncbi:MAG TPA: DUF202 domain-containing protein [Chloroflexota bacterium]
MSTQEDKPKQLRDPDNQARTYMAAERTFLAWLRTGTTLVALGIAGAQFIARNVVPGFPLTRTLSVVLVLAGILLMMTGTWRYRVSFRDIEAGVYRPANRSATLATGLMLLVALLAVTIILLQRSD